MAKGVKKPLGSGRDDRPRIYIRQTMNGFVAWRRGLSGRDMAASTAGTAVDVALASIDYQPAVFFWEGRTDVE